MWKTLALAAAALTLAAAPEVFPVRAASWSGPLPAPRPAGQVPGTFAALCRADTVVDSRRDPAWLGQSFAGDNCQAPRLPPAIDGARASRDQIVAGMAAVARYAAQAGAFQKCVGDFIAARKAAAPLSAPQASIESYRILASQRAAQAAESRMRVAINAFNEYGSDCSM